MPKKSQKRKTIHEFFTSICLGKKVNYYMLIASIFFIMENDPDVGSAGEKEQVIDEFVELLELQIKLREGGFVFKLANALGWPGTRLEHIQNKIKNKQLLRKTLEKQDIGALKQDLEFSKRQLKGLDMDIGRAQFDYQEKLLRFEQMMRKIAESSKKKRRKS